MGTLLTDFRLKKQTARKLAVEKLWKRNGLENPVKRNGYEVREEVISGGGGSEIRLSLWKKVDESLVRVVVNVEAGEVEAIEAVENLLK